MTMKVPASVIKRDTELYQLTKARHERRKRTMKTASVDLILALVDAAAALMKGDILMTPRQLSAIKRHKTNFKNLTKPTANIQSLKKTLRVGGFLPAILGPLTPIVRPDKEQTLPAEEIKSAMQRIFNLNQTSFHKVADTRKKLSASRQPMHQKHSIKVL